MFYEANEGLKQMLTCSLIYLCVQFCMPHYPPKHTFSVLTLSCALRFVFSCKNGHSLVFQDFHRQFYDYFMVIELFRMIVINNGNNQGNTYHAVSLQSFHIICAHISRLFIYRVRSILRTKTVCEPHSFQRTLVSKVDVTLLNTNQQ